MNSWKVILATLVIFGAGVVTGGLLVSHSVRVRGDSKRSFSRPAQSPTFAGSRIEFLRRAQRELNLSPDQNQRIDLLLKESQERTKKLLQPIEGDLRQELQRTREAFRELLKPDQQVRFDELVKRPPRMREGREPRDPHEPRETPRQPPV